MKKIGNMLVRIFRGIAIELLLLYELNQSRLQLKIVGLNSGPNNTTATADSSRSNIISEGSLLIRMPFVNHIIFDFLLKDFSFTLRKLL
ncbi:hypothetical protein PIB30_115268, partial [Stylosanthes scabra]|nr:hypothetical protein [Stylosanthes scabra]